MTTQSEHPQDIQVELAKLLSDVDQGSAITAEQMNKVQTGMENLWQKTQDDDEAHAMITQAWNDVIVLAEQNAAQTFQIVAMGNMTQAALEERNAYRAELGDLQGALEDFNEDHPALADFAEQIREWAQEDFDEWMEDEGWPEAMAEAFEEIRGEVVDKVHRLSGCGLAASNRFVSIIMGRRAQFTPRQEELFAVFMETFVEIVQASEANAEVGEAQHGR